MVVVWSVMRMAVVVVVHLRRYAVAWAQSQLWRAGAKDSAVNVAIEDGGLRRMNKTQMKGHSPQRHRTTPYVGHAHSRPSIFLIMHRSGHEWPPLRRTAKVVEGDRNMYVDCGVASRCVCVLVPAPLRQHRGDEDEVNDRGGHDSIPGISGKKALTTLGRHLPSVATMTVLALETETVH